MQDHNKSGIYKLICKTCNKTYTGQTSRKLTLRFREHIRYIKNDSQSAYAQHILQNIYECGSLKDTMSLLKPIHKTSMLVPSEQLLIKTIHHKGNLIPEQSCDKQSLLFQFAINYSLMKLPTHNRSILTTRFTQTSPNLATLVPYVTTYPQPINTYHTICTNQSRPGQVGGKKLYQYVSTLLTNFTHCIFLLCF